MARAGQAAQLEVHELLSGRRVRTTTLAVLALAACRDVPPSSAAEDAEVRAEERVGLLAAADADIPPYANRPRTHFASADRAAIDRAIREYDAVLALDPTPEKRRHALLQRVHAGVLAAVDDEWRGRRGELLRGVESTRARCLDALDLGCSPTWCAYKLGLLETWRCDHAAAARAFESAVAASRAIAGDADASTDRDAGRRARLELACSLARAAVEPSEADVERFAAIERDDAAHLRECAARWTGHVRLELGDRPAAIAAFARAESQAIDAEDALEPLILALSCAREPEDVRRFEAEALDLCASFPFAEHDCEWERAQLAYLAHGGAQDSQVLLADLEREERRRADGGTPREIHALRRRAWFLVANVSERANDAAAAEAAWRAVLRDSTGEFSWEERHARRAIESVHSR